MLNLIPWSFVTSTGVHLAGFRTPPRGKPVLHFIHGNGFCGLMYSPLWQLLEPHVDLFLSDVQGHGQSASAGRFIGWDASAQAAAQAFEHYANDYRDVIKIGCGHSFGGVVTALWAAHGSPFQQLLLLDPVIFTPWMHRSARVLQLFGVYQHHPLAKQAARRRQHWPDQQAAWQYFYQRGIFKQWRDDALQAYLEHALEQDGTQLTLRCHPSREAEIFASMPRRLWTDLHRMTLPCHVIVGEKTYPFIHKSLKIWLEKHQQLSVTELPGDHCFMQQYPELCAQHMIDQLRATKVL